jgi:hypothetical protein
MRSLTLVVVAVAGLALAACGGHASVTSSAAPSAPRLATTTTAPLTCKQQGAQWKTEHRRTIRTFKDALVPFQSGSVTSAQAHALTAASQAMLVAPLPACADPKGYYTQVMANLATTGQAASGGGTLSEVGALAPMEDALTALNELRAEMKQTIGSGKI